MKNYFLKDGIKIHWNAWWLPDGYEAITLFGHVFDVRDKENLEEYLERYAGKVMVNHERIHMLQAKSFKLGYFTFYILYLWYWIVGLFKYGTKKYASYEMIPFEREAYNNEEVFGYNKTEWRRYIP